MTTYPAAQRPTLWFIGVSTGQSSIMRVFPAWARHLGLDAAIRGIDLPLHAEPARYRETVAFLKADPLSRGALVTTHKLDLFAAARDLIDEVDPLADLMAETSCLSKRGARLIAHAKDPISSGLAIDGFLAPDHFARTGGEALLLGAGGATVAILWHLTRARPDRPARITVTDIAPERLAHIGGIHGAEAGGVDDEAAGDEGGEPAVVVGCGLGEQVVDGDAAGLGAVDAADVRQPLGRDVGDGDAHRAVGARPWRSSGT